MLAIKHPVYIYHGDRKFDIYIYAALAKGLKREDSVLDFLGYISWSTVGATFNAGFFFSTVSSVFH